MNGKLSSTVLQNVIWHPQVLNRGAFPNTALKGRITPTARPLVPTSQRLAPLLARAQVRSSDFWETASYVTLGLCGLGGIGLCVC
jgi:hypothetical protein